jgi:hypothetical protein
MGILTRGPCKTPKAVENSVTNRQPVNARTVTLCRYINDLHKFPATMPGPSQKLCRTVMFVAREPCELALAVRRLPI